MGRANGLFLEKKRVKKSANEYLSDIGGAVLANPQPARRSSKSHSRGSGWGLPGSSGPRKGVGVPGYDVRAEYASLYVVHHIIFTNIITATRRRVINPNKSLLYLIRLAKNNNINAREYTKYSILIGTVDRVYVICHTQVKVVFMRTRT